MKRFITDKLVTWKDEKKRKPLIIRGARQVGKSYTVNDFGSGYFDGHIVTVNFEKHPEWHGIFDLNLDPRRIISELEIVLNTRIEPEKTLLFLDEIQNCPKAISSLRYFYEDIPEQHVIAAGSLLDFELRNISVPVGRVKFLDMYPMNFAEFLIANGRENLAELVMAVPEVLSDTIHKSLLAEVRKYSLVGGMPESVAAYSASGRFSNSLEILNDLINTFREDFSKYAPLADKKCLNSVLSSTARNVGQQIKYTHLAEHFSVPTIKKAFELLQKARIISKVTSASPAGLPLGASASEKKFKAIILDTGVMQQLCGLTSEPDLFSTGLLDIYKGALAEQFTGQELISAGNDPLFYWDRDAKSSTAEVDFLLEGKNGVFPVEVKSGASGKLKSMHMLLKAYPECSAGYVFSEAPFGEIKAQRLIFLPIYYAYRTGLDL